MIFLCSTKNGCYLHTMDKKETRLVRFTVAVRKNTRTNIDKMANQENRSRSAMVDVACEDYCIKNLKQENK